MPMSRPARAQPKLDSERPTMVSRRAKTDILLVPPQVRAARALLGWSRTDLAKVSGVSASTIKQVEAGRTDPKASTLRKLAQTFDAHSITFVAEREWIGIARRIGAIASEHLRRSDEESALNSPRARPAKNESAETRPRSWLGALLPRGDRKRV
jgi:transcriptional regulator with XRE-family HTH domain